MGANIRFFSERQSPKSSFRMMKFANLWALPA